MGAGLHTVGRHLRADVLPTVGAGVLVILGSNRAALDAPPESRPLDALAYVLLSLAVAAVPLRRRAPLPMLGIEAVLVSAYLVIGYPHGPVALALSVAAYAVGLHYPFRSASIFVGKAAVLFAVASVFGGDRILDEKDSLLLDGLGVAAMTAFVVVPGVIGHLVRESKIYAARAAAEATGRKIEEERLRVAREVHDVVGHSLSIISLQAGVALHVLDRRPEQAQLSLEAIRRTSIDALDELRATLELTRAGTSTEAARLPPDSAAVRPGGRGRWRGQRRGGGRGHGRSDTAGTPASPNRPTSLPADRPVRHPTVGDTDRGGADRSGADAAAVPVADSVAAAGRGTAGAGRVPLTGLARLDGLVAEVRLCNVPVELTITGTARPLPPEIDLAAYRIVQESVTNALRHAGPARLGVTLDYRPRRLSVDVVDSPTGGRDEPRPAAASPGHGLVGLSSRVAELNGSFEAGPRPDGGWRVHAELPLPTAERPDEQTASPAAVADRVGSGTMPA